MKSKLFNDVKYIVFLMLLLLLVACKNKSESNNSIERTDFMETDITPKSLEVGCYTFHDYSNSITFEISSIEHSITGKLSYHLADKNANSGTFEGFLIDDVILGDYIFQSEGITSKREVIFKIVNGQLIEGFGPMDEDGICFLNTDHVTYTPIMPLSKTKCPK